MRLDFHSVDCSHSANGSPRNRFDGTWRWLVILIRNYTEMAFWNLTVTWCWIPIRLRYHPEITWLRFGCHLAFTSRPANELSGNDLTEACTVAVDRPFGEGIIEKLLDWDFPVTWRSLFIRLRYYPDLAWVRFDCYLTINIVIWIADHLEMSWLRFDNHLALTAQSAKELSRNGLTETGLSLGVD